MGLPEPARAPAGAPEAGRRHWGSCQHTPKDELGPGAVTQRMSPGGQGQGARCPAAGPPGRAHAFQEPGCLPVPAPETQTRSRAGPTVLPAGPRSGHPAGGAGGSAVRGAASRIAPQVAGDSASSGARARWLCGLRIPRGPGAARPQPSEGGKHSRTLSSQPHTLPDAQFALGWAVVLLLTTAAST